MEKNTNEHLKNITRISRRCSLPTHRRQNTHYPLPGMWQAVPIAILRTPHPAETVSHGLQRDFYVKRVWVGVNSHGHSSVHLYKGCWSEP